MEVRIVNILVLFTLLSLTTFGQNRGTFTSIQGDLSRLAESVDVIGIKDGDTIIFDIPYYHMELFKMDNTTIDTFDTVEPSTLQSIYQLVEKLPNVFFFFFVQPADGYRFFRTVLDAEAKEEMLPLLKQIAHSSYQPPEDSLYFTIFNYAIHPTESQRQELIEFTTPYLSELQLEVFDYLMITEKYLQFDFWQNKKSGNSSMFEISPTKYTSYSPKIDNYAILLEEKRTKCWKFQRKKLRKEFGVKRKEAFSGNVVTKEGLTIRFY